MGDIFKLYDCDVGVDINGVHYDFPHVDSIAIDDPLRVRLTRGVNATNDEGIAFTEGTKEAKTITIPVMNLSKAVFDLLVQAFKNKTRMNGYCISRANGAQKYWKKAILSQEPQQLTVDDSAESMNVSLIFESFAVSEVHKE